MVYRRRDFICTAGAAVLATIVPEDLLSKGDQKMYGLIGKMTAVPGQRDALIAILLEGATAMPGCLSYIIAKDAIDANSIWITEVWDKEDSHNSSLSVPSVKQAIARAKPLIAGFGERIVTEPVGGHGLSGRVMECPHANTHEFSKRPVMSGRGGDLVHFDQRIVLLDCLHEKGQR